MISEEALKYFGSLPFTMLSLFMSISGGVSWELVIRPLQEWADPESLVLTGDGGVGGRWSMEGLKGGGL